MQVYGQVPTTLSLIVLFFLQAYESRMTNGQVKDSPAIPVNVWSQQESGVTASLRGLSVVSGDIAWASGTGGTVLRTIDGGKHWSNVSIAEAGKLDLRSLRAFDKSTCLAVSAGSPGCVFRTEDGGKTWKSAYRNESPTIFIDATAFWDAHSGLAMGDPQEGRFFLIASDDGGKTSRECPSDNCPEADPGEAAFAASGTCLITIEDQYAWVGTGGQHPPNRDQGHGCFRPPIEARPGRRP